MCIWDVFWVCLQFRTIEILQACSVFLSTVAFVRFRAHAETKSQTQFGMCHTGHSQLWADPAGRKFVSKGVFGSFPVSVSEFLPISAYEFCDVLGLFSKIVKTYDSTGLSNLML